MDITHRAWRALEWDRLKEYLAGEALSKAGQELCLAIEPAQQTIEVERLLSETAEALSLLEARSGLSQEGLPELKPTLDRLRSSAELNGLELIQINTTLKLARASKASLHALNNDDFPKLRAYLPDLHIIEPLTQAIEVSLEPSGEVKDAASPKLHGLRQELQKLNARIKDELQRIIHSSTLSKALQEPIYTQRSGRYVLPVEASMRNVIRGIVHDSSASGLTVYIEPMAVFELSNDARVKESEIEHEIARILHELSILSAQHQEPIASSFKTLAVLDFIMSRARFAQRYHGTCPTISDNAEFHLHSARHPLLILQDPTKAPLVVPNDIHLNKKHQSLVITGPNTGGKTVYLKTAGLLALMAKAGLLLPVKAGSTIVNFQEIYADIGDEQSLSQNLSTFSSHLNNIVEIVNKANNNCLVLLDEIGVGTDPREGAALAKAILEDLNSSGAYTIATTHFGELKTLAYTVDGFLNASLDFDDLTLSPTYKMRVGIPGSSKATTIASRLGLRPTIIARANDLLKAEAPDVQEVIDQLESMLKQAIEREQQAKLSIAAAQEMERLSQQRFADLTSEQERLRFQYAQQMEAEFSTGRQLIKQLIADLQKQPSAQAAAKAQKEMEVLRQELPWLSPARSKSSAEALSIGQKVKVRSLNQIAVVEDLLNSPEKSEQAMAYVRAGSLKIKVLVSDLEVLQHHPTESPAKSSKKASVSKKPHKPWHPSETTHQAPVFVRSTSNTLDLRGQRVEPGIANLEKFLDDAVLNSTSPLMIIHGHGTGAMKAAVREYLQNSSYIHSFRPGEIYEGADGVTIVDLS